MTMKFIIITSIFTLILFISCNTNNKDNANSGSDTTQLVTQNNTDEFVPEEKVKLPEWLIGRWIFKSATSHIIEIWTRENDSTFSGEAYLDAGTGTVLSEYLKLEIRNGHMFYIATPLLSNSDKRPVSFSLTEHSEYYLAFENPYNDFPVKIEYSRINKDSIVAMITGIQEGRPDTVLFPMGRYTN